MSKIFLNVPYAMRGIAKLHGANWDGYEEKWYCIGEVPTELLGFVPRTLPRFGATPEPGAWLGSTIEDIMPPLNTSLREAPTPSRKTEPATVPPQPDPVKLLFPAAVQALGSPAKASIWLMTPNPALGDKMPSVAARDPAGLAATFALLSGRTTE
ncbi:DUF5710 domain-containing protein [Chitinibacter sp. GC72]|uniref:DUF5710 domain-containing protein n=1 Tax=Chitinibacter sp. GC72 TaxID=1526917 RepID=UPI0012FC8E93|nr:DUF5710 domain-containing protein [Chitinibacter sp. GC72]